MSTSPPEEKKPEAGSAPQTAAAAAPDAVQVGRTVNLDQLMDFAFLEVVARQRLKIDGKALSCS